MKRISYQLQSTISDDIWQHRFNCFNEQLHYYSNFEASKESYDKVSFHLLFYVDSNFAGYTRLTPCPFNYMELEKTQTISLPSDKYSLEMGRTFILPEYRKTKLLNVILGIGLEICEKIGYEKVVGNVSYEAHLSMPAKLGFIFTGEVVNFNMPFSDAGSHLFYLLKCELSETRQERQSQLQRLKSEIAAFGYEFQVP